MKKILRLFASLKAKLCLSATALLCTLNTETAAAPLVFETETAKVIVVRPIDAWFADQTQQEKSLSDHKSKKVNYDIKHGKDWLIGSPGLFSSPTNHPIIANVSKQLDRLGFDRPRMLSSHYLVIEAPTSVPPLAIQDFLDYQSDIYQQMVMTQGNPDDLQSKNSRNKFIGAALAVSSTLIAGQRFGYDLGATTFLGSGSARDLYSAVATYKSAMAAVELPSIDLTAYKEISIRRTIANPGQIMGQIIIAYKGDKTEAAEHEALVIAVVALTGANSTTAEIEQARKNDFARRKAIWDKCVADGGGACKPEPIRRGGG